MINADKYKKNKFRKLVPTSSSDIEKLQQLTTIDLDQEGTRPHLIISQDIKRSTSKVGVEGVSERYKEKHFAFERRIKTISSMNEREEEPIKNSNSSASQYRLEPKTQQIKQERKIQSLMSIIDEFKLKAQQISNAATFQDLGPADHPYDGQQQAWARIDQLSQKTKQASARLFLIYLQRQLKAIKKQILLQIAQFSLAMNQHQLTKKQDAEPNVIIQIDDEQVKPRKNNCRRNLLNVSKFFEST